MGFTFNCLTALRCLQKLHLIFGNSLESKSRVDVDLLQELRIHPEVPGWEFDEFDGHGEEKGSLRVKTTRFGFFGRALLK